MSIFDEVFKEEIRRKALSRPADSDIIALTIGSGEAVEQVIMLLVVKFEPCTPGFTAEGFEFWGRYDQTFLIWDGQKTVRSYVTWGYECQRCKQTFFRERDANIAEFAHDCLGYKAHF